MSKRHLNFADMDKVYSDLEKLTVRWDRRGYCPFDLNLFIFRLLAGYLLENGPPDIFQLLHETVDVTAKAVAEGTFLGEPQADAPVSAGA